MQTFVGTIHILVAMPYLDVKVLNALNKYADLGEDFEVLIDSGAFTAFKAGKPIALEKHLAFMAWITENARFRHKFIQLDVIGDEEATRSNLQESLRQGFPVLPVFTRGGDLGYLSEIIAEHDYWLLGGVAGGRGSRNYVKYILDFAKEEKPDTKIHLLGFTSKDFLLEYNIHSADASSMFSSTRRFHQHYLWYPQTAYYSLNYVKKFPKYFIYSLLKQARFYIADEYYDKMRKLLEAYYDTRMDIAKRLLIDGELLPPALFSDTSYLGWNQQVQALTGTSLYLAAANAEQIESAFLAASALSPRIADFLNPP